MTVTQRIIECNSHKQIVDLVDSQAKATLREWKRKLIEEAHSLGMSKMWSQRK